MNVKELKTRLERDENWLLKLQGQMNRQHSESLNQLADMATFVQRLMIKINKLERTIEDMRGGGYGTS